ncbi:hypothetical protein QU487_17245 [Crenobacter sp. SG2305]|uniref:hypothetical protein n=1 Tax=Crenobacter oryzisoli TaxID=3056844 RepID=UPI0025AA3B31|nr:hypothetical protein [Crenobacter sp. SG2305]MDN0084485.1 hypothetical protein [Crenobacter sp. SG2305]
MQSNIEKFNYYVGCVFALLQDEFPCRHAIDFVKLIGGEQCAETYSKDGRWTGRYIRDGEIQDVSKELDLAYETVNWLFETGYLIGSVGVTQLGRNAFVTLSPKGLEILKAVPAAIDSKSAGKSIGQELSDAVKSAAKSQVSEIASKALSYLFKVGWDALSST